LKTYNILLVKNKARVTTARKIQYCRGKVAKSCNATRPRDMGIVDVAGFFIYREAISKYAYTYSVASAA